MHLLQACLVYVNTLMVQEVLAEPKWYTRMTDEDWRELTPLFYLHVNPYGRFDLDMDSRLPLAATGWRRKRTFSAQIGHKFALSRQGGAETRCEKQSAGTCWSDEFPHDTI
ncbi:MAG: Tn3 family transposase [Chloroflexi bacterium]|nr:Tn3 family transposase [Chloroflexota bacterium]